MKRILKISLLMLALLLVISACGSNDDKNNNGSSEVNGDKNSDTGNLTDAGLPIVKEKISLDIFTGRPPQSAEDWNDVLVWNEYEKMSNIDVNWEVIQSDSLEEKRNIKMGTNDYPDVFYNAGFSNVDILKYSNQGVFIELTDLIKEHAPNLTKLMEENPEIERAMKFPNGKIYSIPTIFDEDFTSMRIGPKPWIDQQLLDELDMEMPETTDEYYEFLKAVKENTDKTPFGSYSIGMLLRWLNGSFGLVNKGFSHQYIDEDANGDLRFISTSDEYKEMLMYVNKLYSEGLIEATIFEQGGVDKFLANAIEGQYASTVSHDPTELFNIDTMDGAPALEGPFGDKLITGVTPLVIGIGGFLITEDNPYPEATIRWIDHFFSDEGIEFFFMGVEGETYEKDENGNVKYLDKITNSSEGLTFEQELAKYVVWPGGAYAGTLVKEEYFKGLEASEKSLESAQNLKPYIPEEVWAAFTYTDDENKVLSTVGADIQKYALEMRDKFIVGDVDFSEWDNYVSQLENMGLDQYMEVQAEALKRYKSND